MTNNSANAIFHILNGDCLKLQFPDELTGQIIVMRECLVDGDVRSHTLEDFFEVRMKFMHSNYQCPKEDYYNRVVREISKITDIPNNANVYLWFEDDVFCQVNCWFVCHLLVGAQFGGKIFYVRPLRHGSHGFGGLNKDELVKSYELSTIIQTNNLHVLARLWALYKNNQYAVMASQSDELTREFSFIKPAVEALIDSNPENGNFGRPEKVLREILNEMEIPDFGNAFREFSKREPIYGFGDLQVKRLYDRIMNSSDT